jgi:methionyl-tRNA synthetase
MYPESEPIQEQKILIPHGEFKRIEMRVAKIIDVQDIPGKDRLYKLQIDLGTERRQLVAGIKQSYPKEELMEKLILVVTNLQPVTIASCRSEAMLLAMHSSGGKYVLATPDGDVAPGTLIE